MRSVCVCMCVSLSLSRSLLFGALQRPLIGNAHALLCLSFSTFTLLGPTSCMLHGVQIFFVCSFDVHFFGVRLHFLHSWFALFCVVFLHLFFFALFMCKLALCFCPCIFCIFHLFFFLRCVFALALFSFFICFFFALCFCPCIFFCIFHLFFALHVAFFNIAVF